MEKFAFKHFARRDFYFDIRQFPVRFGLNHLGNSAFIIFNCNHSFYGLSTQITFQASYANIYGFKTRSSFYSDKNVSI